MVNIKKLKNISKGKLLLICIISVYLILLNIFTLIPAKYNLANIGPRNSRDVYHNISDILFWITFIGIILFIIGFIIMIITEYIKDNW